MLIEWPGAKRTIEEHASFLLTNGRGGFSYLPVCSADSRFQGVHMMEGSQVYKLIDSLGLGTKPDGLLNRISKIERHSAQAVESFWMHNDVLSYRVDKYKGWVDLYLDCRKIYDYSTKGRIYKISKKGDMLVITYNKFTDDTLERIDYSLYVVIAGIAGYELKDEWIFRKYDYDELRRSEPSSAFVYHALRFTVDGSARILFSCSTGLQSAISQAEHALENHGFIEKSIVARFESLTQTGIDACPEILNAYRSSVQALDGFLVKNKELGLIAGYPWFTQVWSRDEAISLGALIREKRYDDFKSIFCRQLANIDEYGRIPNRYPGSELGSSDAVGWFWFRFHDFIKHVPKLNDFFSIDELLSIRKTLQVTLDRQRARYTADGFCVNGPLETWMDTSYKDDVRAGARIEIQALHLAMYDLMVTLCRVNHEEALMHTYRELEHVMAKHVKAQFWKKPVLSDGLGDNTIRPNIFIANYVYPNILTKREWMTAFNHALKQLYLDWGGLSTIDRNHKYFIDHYTGEDNRSYHRGDSWFFMNNMAAICMFRLDPHRYEKHIKAILSASTKEILYSGIIGSHAELSDAKKLSSRGSLSQCWSTALFIELIHHLQDSRFLQSLSC